MSVKRNVVTAERSGTPRLANAAMGRNLLYGTGAAAASVREPTVSSYPGEIVQGEPQLVQARPLSECGFECIILRGQRFRRSLEHFWRS